MRVGVFDIETWDLDAKFGPILVASVLDLTDDTMTTFRQDAMVRRKLAEDMTDDRELVVGLRDLLETFHITVGWYSKGFDIAHVRTRLATHDERLLKSQLHLDPMWYFKGWRGLKPGSAKLGNVSKFFGLEEKPEVPPEVWLKARGGNKKAIDEVVERCEADVRITAELMRKALDLELVKNITRYP